MNTDKWVLDSNSLGSFSLGSVQIFRQMSVLLQLLPYIIYLLENTNSAQYYMSRCISLRVRENLWDGTVQFKLQTTGNQSEESDYKFDGSAS